MTTGYCVKERKKVEIQNPTQVTMKNGRPAIQGFVVLFDHPTVSALASHLASTALRDLFPQHELKDAEDGQRTHLLDEVENLSQDDMESLIAEEFSRLKPS